MESRPRAYNGTAETLTRWKVSRLLRPESSNISIEIEEQRHPWSVNRSQELERPLLRIWDGCSGSRPEKDLKMLSRSPDEALGTREARKDSLALHLYHGNWKVPTPYISFTTSAEEIKNLANFRIGRRRGDQTLTVVDPKSRIRNGLPVLDVLTEMEYYSIPDPYRRGSAYYIEHYVCLWEVTAEEIVGHWKWHELAAMDNWYEEVIMPAFNDFRKRKGLKPSSASAPALASAFDMSGFMKSLPSKSSARVLYIQLIVKVPGETVVEETLRSEDSDESFEEYDCDANIEFYDSDDEVEEANRNDDIIKVFEGDW